MHFAIKILAIKLLGKTLSWLLLFSYNYRYFVYQTFNSNHLYSTDSYLSQNIIPKTNIVAELMGASKSLITLIVIGNTLSRQFPSRGWVSPFRLRCGVSIATGLINCLFINISVYITNNVIVFVNKDIWIARLTDKKIILE